MVEKIAQIYGDPNTDNINVRSISENPTKLTWTNTTLTNPRSPMCPMDQLLAVQEVCHCCLASYGMDISLGIAFVVPFLLGMFGKSVFPAEKTVHDTVEIF